MYVEDIGKVYNVLREKKLFFSGKVEGRRRSENETEAAQIMRKASGRFSDLEDFLKTQGLKLIVKEAQHLGIEGDCLIYITVRDPLAEPPSHLCGGQLIREMQTANSKETVEQLTIWATFMSLNLLHFLYSIEERPIEAISEFKDSSVDKESFLIELSSKIEELRRENADDDSRRQTILSTLTSSDEKQIRRKVDTFFAAMVKLGVIELVENVSVLGKEDQQPVYRQTLWSAVDIETNFRRYAPHLVVENIAEQIDSVGSGVESVELEEEERE